MCRLIFETVKWENGAPCLLPWHQRRVEASIGVHGSDGAPVPDLASVLSACPGPESRGVYKCHITYDTRGRVRRTSFEPYRPRQVQTLTCVEMPGWITHASGRIGQGFWRQGRPWAVTKKR